MALAPAPTPIDPRAPRLNQAVLTVGLLAGGLTDQRWVVPLFAVVLGLGAAFGPRYGPVLRFYATVVRPRLGPSAEWEDPRPPRFAAAVGVGFLVASALAFLAGSPGLGWGLATVVAVLAGLAAVSGLCVGCEVWIRWARWRATPDEAALDGVLPLVAGRSTDVVFTTPWCANCEPTVDELRRSGDGEIVVIDATERPDLAEAHDVRRAPTVLRFDAGGTPIDRLVGLPAVRDAVRAPA